MFGSMITGVAGLAFPMFASYRALASNDISLIRPWLMYWVVLATFQFAEDMFRPILRLVPFYGFIRMFFVVWMILPSTQGGVQLYETHLEPWLRSHSQQIDRFVNTVVGIIDATPLPRIGRFIFQLFFTEDEDAPAAGKSAGNAKAAPNSAGNSSSVLDSILSSFKQTTNPDANLSAYLPAILGGSGVEGESYGTVRNRLLGLVRLLDMTATPPPDKGVAAVPTASATVGGSSSVWTQNANQPSPRSPDQESFAFVDIQRDQTPGVTEIEREVESDILAKGKKKAN